MTTRLITIPFSHYCEKARWALDRCGVAYVEEGHLPIFHYLAARRAGGHRTVPVVVDGDTVLPDSTDIIAWADKRRPATLLPSGTGVRSDALALEDDLDRHYGPATRRWGYYYILGRKHIERAMLETVPRWQRAMFPVARPFAIQMLKRGLKIDAAGVERSRAKIEETFANVNRLLADGRQYLVGDRFTVADLTFAALSTPILLPPKHPAKLPTLDDFEDEPRRQIEAWRATLAGQHALRMYDVERANNEPSTN